MPRRLTALDLAGVRARLRPHRAEDADAAYALLAGQDEILRSVWLWAKTLIDLGGRRRYQ